MPIHQPALFQVEKLEEAAEPMDRVAVELEEKRFRNYGTDAARSERVGQGSNEVDEKNDQIAHRRIVAEQRTLEESWAK